MTTDISFQDDVNPYYKAKIRSIWKFLDLKAKLENQSGKRIKILITDSGGEFIGNAFMNYYKEKKINKQLTIR